MAEIVPFRGVLYNPAKVGDLNKVMAPPYDVISPKKQDELYERHPNNIIRIILGKTTPEDTQGSDRYSRSAVDLEKWLGEGVLAHDEKPALYYYTQTYTQDGSKHTRKGFIGLSRLVDFGKGIHPHEKTLSGPKADRLKLMQACDANMSCIFTLYSDPVLRVNKLLEAASAGKAPDIDVTDDDGIVNRIWRVDDQQTLNGVTESMKDKSLFIADGHHRYETALNYRNEMRKLTGDTSGEAPFDYVMMMFVNMDSKGLSVLPTHRALKNMPKINQDKLQENLNYVFDLQKFESVADVMDGLTQNAE